MKQAIIISLFLFLLTNQKLSAQTIQPYETTIDSSNTKILKGLISRTIIESDTSFKWFKQNMQLGQANANAVEAFKQNGSKFQMIIFVGTWCEDTQNLLPVFYRLVNKSGYDENNITLVAVDREKTTLDNLHKAFSIADVPTFIVMKDGKEVGRVVEYGKYGQIDKELGEIVSTL